MKPDFDLKYIIYMKYGVHTSELLPSIISRKTKEIEDTGLMFWGYGGTLCHPIKQIQPFVEMAVRENKSIYLVMSRTFSDHHGESSISKSYSIDGKNYYNMPNGVAVLGSKYALICNSFMECNFQLNLSDYNVAVGSNQGKRLSQFIRSRVDKGCGIRVKRENFEDDKFVTITLIAELTPPFAALIAY